MSCMLARTGIFLADISFRKVVIMRDDHMGIKYRSCQEQEKSWYFFDSGDHHPES